VHIGGLTQLVLQSLVQTIYIIVWASSNILLHLENTKNVEELQEKHFGIRLQICPFQVLLTEDYL
jgi:hypothetical protein